MYSAKECSTLILEPANVQAVPGTMASYWGISSLLRWTRRATRWSVPTSRWRPSKACIRAEEHRRLVPQQRSGTGGGGRGQPGLQLLWAAGWLVRAGDATRGLLRTRRVLLPPRPRRRLRDPGRWQRSPMPPARPGHRYLLARPV